MTDLEVIEKVVSDLESINVPVGLMQQIGLPIAKSSRLLRELHAAITKSVQEKQENTPEEIKMETEPEVKEGEAND